MHLYNAHGMEKQLWAFVPLYVTYLRLRIVAVYDVSGCSCPLHSRIVVLLTGYAANSTIARLVTKSVIVIQINLESQLVLYKLMRSVLAGSCSTMYFATCTWIYIRILVLAVAANAWLPGEL